MTLKQLTCDLQMLDTLAPQSDPEILSITADSRQATPGSLYVAIKGTNVDGHDFIPQLNGKGVAAIVCERFPDNPDPAVAYLKVADTSQALGELASAFYGHPSRKLKLVGVTGTNGKTTTATLIYDMARLSGYRAGLLSTVVNRIDDLEVPATQTTPDPITLNHLLAQMVDAGCTIAAMEVSSHAAHQKRIAGLKFAGGIFTNLTRDHLDYHGTFAAYLQAKQSFFNSLDSSAFAITNIDDPNGPIMVQNTRARRLSYSLRQIADYHTRIIEQQLDGTLIDINGHQLHTLFTGRFNAYNLTAVYGACLQLGMPMEQTLLNLSRLHPVAGRFQTIHSPAGAVTAIVDYAHTPDALLNVLQAIRQVVGPTANVITVVGAGGNRDKGKRPQMALQAAQLSTSLILTSDNPRFENPLDILADMHAGVADLPEMAAKTTIIADRAQAIAHAIATAQPSTVVLIAGKGHEDYQEICGVKHHFDDREQAAAALAKLTI